MSHFRFTRFFFWPSQRLRGFLKVLIEFFVYFRLNLWNEIQKYSNALFEVFYFKPEEENVIICSFLRPIGEKFRPKPILEANFGCHIKGNLVKAARNKSLIANQAFAQLCSYFCNRASMSEVCLMLQFTSLFDVIQLVGHKSFISYLGGGIRQKKY